MDPNAIGSTSISGGRRSEEGTYERSRAELGELSVLRTSIRDVSVSWAIVVFSLLAAVACVWAAER